MSLFSGVDVIHNIVNKPELIEKWVKHKVTYAVGFCNGACIGYLVGVYVIPYRFK